MQQRDVPGIDCAFLAMDTEEGVEVVWNEVRISEKKSSKVQLVSSVSSFNLLVFVKYCYMFVLLSMWIDGGVFERVAVSVVAEFQDDD